jgi:hypothetical protein
MMARLKWGVASRGSSSMAVWYSAIAASVLALSDQDNAYG